MNKLVTFGDSFVEQSVHTEPLTWLDYVCQENDLILDNESNNNFLDSLNKTLDKKPILIKLAQQGHCLKNLNLYEILLNTIND